MSDVAERPAAVRTDILPCGIALYSVESRTRLALAHHVGIDLATGRCYCSCEHWRMRLYPRARAEGRKVDIGSVRDHCWHIEAAIADCILNGEIEINTDSDKVIHDDA